MGEPRKAIAEDFDHDLTFKRQRMVAGYLIGALINAAEGGRPVWENPPDIKALAKQAKQVALEMGIVSYDEWHHAPMCPSNNWGKQMLPTAPCNCGAARKGIR